MRFVYGDVEAVIRAIHGGGSKPTALLGRVKYMQRLGWPPDGAKGQGSKLGYGLAQLVGMALAFEMLEMGLPPVRVVRLLRTSWPDACAAVARGWAQRRADRPVLLMLNPGALAELGTAEDAERPTPDSMEATTEGGLLDWVRGDAAGGTASCYLIDAGRVARALRTALVARQVATGEDVDEAFVELGEELFGTKEPLGWKALRR